MDTRKQKIAELLYDLPTNKLSTEDINWVMSHLPEDNARGKESTRPEGLIVYDQSKNEFNEVIGFGTKEVSALMRKLADSFPQGGKGKQGVVMEAFFPKLNEREKCFMIAHGVPSFHEFTFRYLSTLNDRDLQEVLDEQGWDETEKASLAAKIRSLRDVTGLLDKLRGLAGDI